MQLFTAEARRSSEAAKHPRPGCPPERVVRPSADRPRTVHVQAYLWSVESSFSTSQLPNYRIGNKKWTAIHAHWIEFRIDVGGILQIWNWTEQRFPIISQVSQCSAPQSCPLPSSLLSSSIRPSDLRTSSRLQSACPSSSRRTFYRHTCSGECRAIKR